MLASVARRGRLGRARGRRDGAQKQERLLGGAYRVVVATPGRLWELMNERNHEHFADLGRLQFLVLDEADRMVGRGLRRARERDRGLPMPRAS